MMMFHRQPQQPIWRRSTINRLCLTFFVVFTLSSSWLVGVTQCACSDRSSRRNRVSLNDDYGVLIDAGSTGTRVWVYSWPRDKDDGTEEPLGPTVPPIECRYTHKVPKGLAEYAEDPERLREVIVTLIGKAKDQVPDKLHSTTSIFLMATAGQSYSSSFVRHLYYRSFLHPFDSSSSSSIHLLLLLLLLPSSSSTFFLIFHFLSPILLFPAPSHPPSASSSSSSFTCSSSFSSFPLPPPPSTFLFPSAFVRFTLLKEQGSNELILFHAFKLYNALLEPILNILKSCCFITRLSTGCYFEKEKSCAWYHKIFY